MSVRVPEVKTVRLALPVMLLAVLGYCLGCAGPSFAPAGTGEQSAPQHHTGSTARMPVATVGPRTPAQPAPSSVLPLSPTAPASPGGPAVFSSASAVSIEWLRQWCTLDWREPMNANLDRAARYQTAAAAREDRRKGDDENTYRAAQAEQLSSGCDQIVAAQSPEAPRSVDIVYLVLSARRVNSASGIAFESEQVSEVRRVARQPDGRWLVDEEAGAG